MGEGREGRGEGRGGEGRGKVSKQSFFCRTITANVMMDKTWSLDQPKASLTLGSPYRATAKTTTIVMYELGCVESTCSQRRG
jgi:hypothetical protein